MHVRGHTKLLVVSVDDVTRPNFGGYLQKLHVDNRLSRIAWTITSRPFTRSSVQERSEAIQSG